jgi:hypothetical protein
MRLQNKLSIGECTPNANEAIPVLKEINGTFKFIVPTGVNNFTLTLVYQNKRTRLYQRIHVPIIGSYERVAVILKIQTVKKSQRNLSPRLDQTAEIAGATSIDSRIKRERHLHIAAGIGAEGDHMRGGNIDSGCISGLLSYIYSVPAQDLGDIKAIDCTQGIKPENRRNGSFIFYVGEPAKLHNKLIILMPVCDLNTGFFHIPITQIQTLANALQLLPRVVKAATERGRGKRIGGGAALRLVSSVGLVDLSRMKKYNFIQSDAPVPANSELFHFQNRKGRMVRI